MERKSMLKEWGIAALRIAVGGVFIAHGAQKLFTFGLAGTEGFMAQQGIPFPFLSALAVTATELFGGLALVAGAFTRWAALPLAFAMFVAVTAVHWSGGFFLPNGVEYALTLMVASVAIALTGSGAFSIDGLLSKRREEKTPVVSERAAVQLVEAK